MAKEILDAVVKVSSDISNLKTGMKKAQKSIGGLQKFAKSAAGALGGIFAVQSLIRGAKAVGEIFVDFEAQMSDVRAVTQATDADMERLKDTAIALGSSTKFTATEVGQLEKEFAKLGFSTDEIINASGATLDLAAATGTELARAAEITGSAIRAFGLDTKETSRVVDVFAAASSQSALDMEKIATAMATVAPVAANAGYTIEQTTGFLGKLVDAGIDASTAGTGLRNIFLELSKRGITLDTALRSIRDATDKNARALELFGKRGATVGAVLADNQTAAEALAVSISKSGVAAQMASDQLDNLKGDLTIAKSVWQGFVLSIEDGDGAINKALRSIVQGFTSVLQSTSGLKQGFIDNFNEMIKGSRIFTSIIQIVKNAVVLNFKIMGNVVMTLAEPFLLLGRIIKNVFTDGFKGAKDAFVTSVNRMKERWSSFGEDVIDIGQQIRDAITGDNVDQFLIANEKIATTAQETATATKTSFKEAGDAITEAIDITEDADDFVDDIKRIQNAEEDLMNTSVKMSAIFQQIGREIQSTNLDSIKSFKQYTHAVLSAIRRVIQAKIAEGVASAITDKLKIPIVGSLLAPAAGLAAVALFNNLVPKFAEGGAAAFTKPTLGVLGEAPGISRSNPEIMGTAKQLRGMFASGDGYIAETRISGSDLRILLKRVDKEINTFS